MRRPSRALTAIRSPAGTRPAVRLDARTAGRESVTWRGRAPRGPRPGRAAATGPAAGSRSRRSPRPRRRRATSRSPARHRPTARSARPSWPRRPCAGSSAAVRGHAWAARLAQAAHDQVDQAVVDLDVHDAAAIRRGQRDIPVAPRWLAVLALAVGEDDAVTAIRGAAHDLEPPVGVRHVDQRPVGQPLRAGVVAALASDDLALAGRDVDDRDREVVRSSGACWAITAIRLPSGDHTIRRRRGRWA